MRFRSIENPKQVQEQINGLMKKEQSDTVEGEKSQKEIMKEMLSELKEINEKLNL